MDGDWALSSPGHQLDGVLLTSSKSRGQKYHICLRSVSGNSSICGIKETVVILKRVDPDKSFAWEGILPKSIVLNVEATNIKHTGCSF